MIQPGAKRWRSRWRARAGHGGGGAAVMRRSQDDSADPAASMAVG
jgi:hypothetical protein